MPPTSGPDFIEQKTFLLEEYRKAGNHCGTRGIPWETAEKMALVRYRDAKVSHWYFEQEEAVAWMRYGFLETSDLNTPRPEISADSKPIQDNALQLMGRHGDRIISGEWSNIGFPWPALSRLTRANLPGSITLFCGSGGSTKSFMLLQALIHWRRRGVRAAVFMLEKGHTFHLHRAIAMLAGDSDLLDDEKIRANPQPYMDALSAHKEELDEIRQSMTVAETGKQITLQMLSAWIEGKAAEGNRIIAVDPITMATPGRAKSWEADAEFMTRAIHVCDKAGASLILVTHPRKGAAMQRGGKKGKGGGGAVTESRLDDLAGGSTYARNSDTVLIIDASEPHEARVQDYYNGRNTQFINRLISIEKARSGQGAGKRIGIHFDGGTLTADEKGLIVNE